MLETLLKSETLRPLLRRGRGFYRRHVFNLYHRWKLAAEPFPPEIWIENTNYCNAACVMCPREKLTRPMGFMDLAHYERLIKEISLHGKTVSRVHMHNFGEPLLDKDLPKRVEIAKKHGIQHTYFVTNASALTPKLSESLIRAGLDAFKISFYGTDKETYNTTMVRLDFDKTLRNVTEFFEIRRRLGARKPKVNIQFLPQKENEGMKHFEEWQALFKPFLDAEIGDELSLVPLLNFGDGREYHQVDMEQFTSICTYPWRTMVVLHDGRVVLCCLDYNGAQVVGDTKTQTLEEVWNGPLYRKAREDFARVHYSDWSLCKKCDIPMK